MDTRIAFHRSQHIIGLISDGIQCCPDNMVFINTPAQADDHAPGIGIPIGRTQAGKGRHHDTTVGIRHLSGHIFGIRSRFNKTQLIPQPLNRRTGYKNRTFQSIGYFAI